MSLGEITATPGMAKISYQTRDTCDVRQAIIDVLRQQEGLKKKLHGLLDQLGTQGIPTID